MVNSNKRCFRIKMSVTRAKTIRSVVEHLKPANNRYKNPFGTEIALFRTSERGMARLAVSGETPGFLGEMGRIRGQIGSSNAQI